MLKFAVALAGGFSASETVTVNFAVPGVPVGVPEMTPALLTVSPAGRLPLEIDHVNGCTPPAAAIVWLYATPTVAVGSVAVVITGGGCDELLLEPPQPKRHNTKYTTANTRGVILDLITVPLVPRYCRYPTHSSANDSTLASETRPFNPNEINHQKTRMGCGFLTTDYTRRSRSKWQNMAVRVRSGGASAMDRRIRCHATQSDSMNRKMTAAAYLGHVLLCTALLVGTNCGHAPQHNESGVVQHSLIFGGSDYQYFLSTPATSDGTNALPVLFLVHGSGGDGLDFIQFWRDLANQNGIILLAPTFRFGADLEKQVPELFPALVEDAK